MDIIRDHTRLIKINSFLGDQAFVGPVLVMFYLKYVGISFAEFCWLDSMFFFLIAFFEVPSGYIADRFGRKRVFLLSQTMYLVSFLIILLFPSFDGAFCSLLIAGIFTPLGSGNIDAVYYETFENNGKVNELRALYGKANSNSFFVAALCSLFSGFMFDYWKPLPLLIDSIAILISVLTVSTFLHDDESYRALNKEFDWSKLKITNVKSFFKDNLMLWNFFFISALVFAVLRGAYSFYQPLFELAHIDVQFFGFIFAGFNIVAAFASRYSARIIHLLATDKKILLSIIFIILTSMVGINFTFKSPALLLCFLVLQQVMRGYSGTYFQIQNNKYIPENSSLRVTYLSIQNLSSTLLVSLTLLGVGFLTSQMALKKSLIFFFVIVLLLLCLTYIFHIILSKKRIGKDVV